MTKIGKRLEILIILLIFISEKLEAKRFSRIGTNVNCIRKILIKLMQSKKITKREVLVLTANIISLRICDADKMEEWRKIDPNNRINPLFIFFKSKYYETLCYNIIWML